MNLDEIKQYLTEKNYDAVLITRNNHFLGQDVLETENRILALTGFSGSAGTLVVTKEKAYLFTDGRYEIQAARQTDPKTTEVLCGRNETLTNWLREKFPGRAKMEYNPWCLSIREVDTLSRLLPKLKLVAKAQTEDLEPASVFAHELRYCGVEATEKYRQVVEFLRQNGCEACLIAGADSVSWLTNLRSDALPDTPIVRAMALVRADADITLFADGLSFPLDTPCRVLPLAKMEKELAAAKELTFALDEQRTPDAVRRMMEKHEIKIRPLIDPCLGFKARKNETEIRGFADAHLRDGIAVCKFLCWLEHNYEDLSELDVVEKIHELRKQQPLFYSDSFPTIAGAGANAAIIHYQPTENTNARLEKNSLLLVDSGGQYFNGTTDITRTVALGCPAKEMTEKFTVVLKAHIALASARLPQGVSGNAADIICRSVMWRRGLDYKHGTGHGVGCFLNVHEGPQNFSLHASSYPLAENMIVSIEPGYYRENAFGIRIENLARIVVDEESGMLKFAVLTLAPLDKRLIDKYLLTDEEISWLNDYHRDVLQKVSPYLTEEEKIWLKEACSSL